MDDQKTAPIPEVPDPDRTQVMEQVPPPSGPPGTGVATGETPPPDDRRRTSVVVAVIVVLILLLGACAAAYLWQRRQADDLERRATEAEERLADLEADASDEETTEPEPEAEPETEPEDEPEPEDGPDPDPEPSPDPMADGRYIGLVTDIYNVAQSRWIEIDYIQFLTGDEAADAAAARGDESPPPNDYYIVNDNPMLREFNVREGLAVTMWTWNMETDGVMEQSIPFDIWWDEIEMHGVGRYLTVPYWVTIDNGTVIEIEEQFLP